MGKRICDWHGCMAVAVHSVRVDVPRGNAFTSLVWQRCGDHTPAEREGQWVAPIGGGVSR